MDFGLRRSESASYTRIAVPRGSRDGPAALTPRNLAVPAPASLPSAARRRIVTAIVWAGLACIAGPALAADPLPADAPLPAAVPPGTTLVIGDPTTQKALQLSGEIDKLPFKVEWANISGGPRTIEAFR